MVRHWASNPTFPSRGQCDTLTVVRCERDTKEDKSSTSDERGQRESEGGRGKEEIGGKRRKIVAKQVA